MESKGVIFILGRNRTRKHSIVLMTLLSLSISLIGCSTATTAHSTLSMATNSSDLTNPEKVTVNSNYINMDNSRYKIVMDNLVKNGTITVAQQIAIQTAITIANQDAAANGDFNCIDNYGSKYVMDGLVKDGTITIAQQVAIQSVIITSKEDGTLTKEQEIFKTQ